MRYNIKTRTCLFFLIIPLNLVTENLYGSAMNTGNTFPETRCSFYTERCPVSTVDGFDLNILE